MQLACANVVLIRHGESLGQKLGPGAGRDDPLSPVGRAQAADAAEVYARDKIQFDRVFVSPLSRAMETCATILAECLTPFTVDPRLREFNSYQTSDAPLIQRHTGRPYSELRTVFPSPAFRWPDDGGGGGDHEWWEPHGGVAECVQRASDFLVWLAGECLEHQWKSVALVAHENLFRQMSFFWGFTNCSMTPFSLFLDTRSASRPSAQLLSHDLVDRVRTHQLITVVCNLSCVSLPVQHHRIEHAADETLAALNQGRLAILAHQGAAYEATPLREYLTAQWLTSDEDNAFKRARTRLLRQSTLLDPRSKSTVCNVRHCGLLINALRAAVPSCTVDLRLVTSDWHMPRALTLFRQHFHPLPITPVSALTSHSLAMHLKTTHLLESAVFLPAVLRGVSSAERTAITALCASELATAAAHVHLYYTEHFLKSLNQKEIAQQNLSVREQLVVLLNQGDIQLDAILALLCTSYHQGYPLAHVSLDDHDPTATALRLATKLGATAVAEEIKFFFGGE